jgi:hypothetical protein
VPKLTIALISKKIANLLAYNWLTVAATNSDYNIDPQISERSKASPKVADNVSVSGRSKSDKSGCCLPDKNLNESLKHLQHDIRCRSLISSRGPSPVLKNTAPILSKTDLSYIGRLATETFLHF